MTGVTKEILQHMTNMVQDLKQRGILKSPNIKRAFLSIPRHLFINRLPPLFLGNRTGWTPIDPFNMPSKCLEKIYCADIGIQLKPPPPASSSAPAIMALMLEAADLTAGLRVLEIGTGSGYNTSLIMHIIGDQNLVYTVENQRSIMQEARENLQRVSLQDANVIYADGGYGYKAGAPYDRIIATASIYDIPVSWYEQLAEGGSIIAPVWMSPGWMPIVRLVKNQGKLTGSIVDGASFMAMQGDFGYDEFRHIIDTSVDKKIKDLLETSPVKKNIQLPIHIEQGYNEFAHFMDFNAFVHMVYPNARGLRYIAKRKIAWLSLWDEDLYSLCALWVPDWKIEVYGNDKMYYQLLKLIDQWEKLGFPEVSKYNISVSIQTEYLKKKKGNIFAQFRSWNMWEFSLTI